MEFNRSNVKTILDMGSVDVGQKGLTMYNSVEALMF